MIGFDKIDINEDLLIGLPFEEGTDLFAYDRAKPHHILTQNVPGGGSFSWGNEATGVPYIEFVTLGAGVTDGVYFDCPAVNTVDLDFTNDDYSIGGWINWEWNGTSSLIIGRYGVDLDGWEIYLDISGGLNTVSQRHHHSSLAPNNNSNCYSTGWTPSNWWLLGISRSGASLYPQHYRNAEPLDMSYEDTGMLDPDTCNRDLVIGCRYTKNANWYKSKMWNLRVWGRCLTQEDWSFILHREGNWFGL
jgi:hypothetical protein